MAASKPSVKEAQTLASTDPRKAEAIYKDIISKPPSVNSDAAIKEYETALLSLGALYRDEKSVDHTLATPSCILTSA
jgi:26S proteasome regulatory subunit N6